PIVLSFLALAGLLLQPIGVQAQPGGKLVNIDNVRIGFITGPSEPGDPGDLKNRLSYFKPGAWTPVYVDITAGPQGLENATLTVETTDNDDIQNTYTVPVPRLDPKESVQVISYVKPGSGGGDIVFTVNKGNQSAKHTRSFSQLDHLNLNELLYL